MVKGSYRSNVDYLPEVILERDKERRELRSHCTTEAMSDAVAAQKRPGPSGSSIFGSLRRCFSGMCHSGHIPIVAPCTDLKSGTPNSQDYSDTTPRKKIRLSQLTETKKILRRFNLHSVCEESGCPNISECFGNRTATFLILGNVCTRDCTFCNVRKGSPVAVDANEPERVAAAVEALGIEYVVVTSVTRDDLPDGGADMFRRTVLAVKRTGNLRRVEVLIPDFLGSEESIQTVVGASPDVISHNMETVPRLYRELRSRADYNRSLGVLSAVKKLNRGQATKSGIMLGLGETADEVLTVMKDLADTGCDFLSIGQYLAPSKTAFPVKRTVEPDEFKHYEKEAKGFGFKHAESGTYVRTSYHASFYPKLL